MNTLPLIEKYRPTKLEQILLDDYVSNIIKEIIRTKQLNHTIISGNSGIGKTTTARCLSKKLFGKYTSQYVLEINASDLRGKTIGEQIINFCKKSINLSKEEQKNYPKYKIIILDEADNMTEKAQNIISDIMTNTTNKCKFILTCNDSHYMSESIQSICDIIRYKRVDLKLISLRLEDICDLEKIKYEKEGLDYISEVCEGDMRTALNILGHTFTNYDIITVDNVTEMYGKPHRKIIKKIIKKCIKNKAYISLKLVRELRKNGHNGYDIISGIFDVLKSPYCNDIDDSNKYRIIWLCSHTLLNISKGIDSDIQLFSCILKMCPE
jgi:DNA polymerase III delta prime subunit